MASGWACTSRIWSAVDKSSAFTANLPPNTDQLVAYAEVHILQIRSVVRRVNQYGSECSFLQKADHVSVTVAGQMYNIAAPLVIKPCLRSILACNRAGG